LRKLGAFPTRYSSIKIIKFLHDIEQDQYMEVSPRDCRQIVKEFKNFYLYYLNYSPKKAFVNQYSSYTER